MNRKNEIMGHQQAKLQARIAKISSESHSSPVPNLAPRSVPNILPTTLSNLSLQAQLHVKQAQVEAQANAIVRANVQSQAQAQVQAKIFAEKQLANSMSRLSSEQALQNQARDNMQAKLRAHEQHIRDMKIRQEREVQEQERELALKRAQTMNYDLKRPMEVPKQQVLPPRSTQSLPPRPQFVNKNSISPTIQHNSTLELAKNLIKSTATTSAGSFAKTPPKITSNNAPSPHIHITSDNSDGESSNKKLKIVDDP